MSSISIICTQERDGSWKFGIVASDTKANDGFTLRYDPVPYTGNVNLCNVANAVLEQLRESLAEKGLVMSPFEHACCFTIFNDYKTVGFKSITPKRVSK